MTATDVTTVSISGTSGTISVSPGPASTLVVADYPVTTTAGTPNSFTVTARDAFGNMATGYTGTVHFTSSDPQASVPGNATLTNGSGSFSATLRSAGSQSITATDTVTSAITGTQSGIGVSPLAVSRLAVVASTGSIVAGDALGVTVTSQGRFGNPMTTYTGTIHFTSTDSQGTLPANYTFVVGDNGTHTFTNAITLKTAGSQTVTVTDIVASSITGTTSPISVSALDVSQLAVVAATGTTTAGSPISVTVTAQDQYGNTIAGYTGTVVFSSTDAQATLPTDFTFVAGNNGTHTFSNAVTLRTAGSQTVTAGDSLTGTITGTSSPIGVVKLSEAKAMDAKSRAHCRLADFHGRTPPSVTSSHTA